MFKKVNEMESSMSQEAKEEMKAMMDSVMETTHQLAVGAAAEQVELMAKVVENNLTQSAEAREDTAKNVRALMGKEAVAEAPEAQGKKSGKRAASSVEEEGAANKHARGQGGSQGGSSSNTKMPGTPPLPGAARTTRSSSGL